jgi:VanZ family protein
VIEKENLKAPVGFDYAREPPHRRFSRYAPLLIWATLIFIGSSDLLSASHTSNFLVRPLHWLFPRAGDNTLALIHFLLRKAGHFTEYAILAWLAARAFLTSPGDFLSRRWFLISLVCVIAYSLTDEFHQSFVATRTASIYDSLIDSAGGLVALTVLWLWKRRRAKPKAIVAA